MVTRNGGRDVLPTVGMMVVNRAMIVPGQTALVLAGATTGPSLTAPPIMIGLEGHGHPGRVHPVPVLTGTLTTQAGGPISQRAFPAVPITGRMQTVPGAMLPDRTALRDLAGTAIRAPMTVVPVAVIATPVLRVLSVVPVIARILTVPIDFRLTNPVSTATGVTAAMAMGAGAGKKAAAESQGMGSGLPDLPASTGMSVGMTVPVFRPTGTEMTLRVSGPAVVRVGMSAPGMLNPLVPPVSVGTRAPVTTIGSVIQKGTEHPAFRVVRAGVTGPISQRLNG